MSSGESTPLLRQSSSISVSVRQSQLASRLITVEPIMVIFAMYRVSSVTLIQQYMYDRIGQREHFADNATQAQCHNMSHTDPYYKTQQEVQAEASLWLMYQKICVVTIGFFSTIFLGGYSDKAGRKIALVSSLVGSLMRLYVFAIVVHYNLPLGILLLGGVLDGLFGGMPVFYMAAFSYLSDVTTTKQRTLRIIILEVCSGVGTAVSYVTTGYMNQYIGYMGTIIALHIAVFISLLLCIFTIPESLKKASGLKVLSFEHFKESFRVYLIDDGTGRRSILLTSMLILLLICPIRLGKDDVTILFTYNSPLCWDALRYGYFQSFFGLITCVGSIVLAKFLQPRVGDLSLVLIGCLSSAASSVFMAFSRTTLMMYIVTLIGIFSTLPIGMIRAFNSKVVQAHELGAMFSWVAWIELLGSLLGSVIFNNIYRATLSSYNGLVFMVLGGLALLTAIVTIGLMVKIRGTRFFHTRSCSPTNDS